MEPNAEKKSQIQKMPRRTFLKLGTATAGVALLSMVDTSNIGQLAQKSILLIEKDPILKRNMAPYLIFLSTGIALACPRNGNPTEGICYSTWFGELLIHEIHFLNTHNDGKLNIFRKGAIPLSPFENGGNSEVETWGWEQRHQVFRLHAPEWGNGLGINVTPEAFNPGNPIWKDPNFLTNRPVGIKYTFNGGVDLWEWDEDPITHEKRLIAKENFKFRRMYDDWSGPIPIPGTNKFYEWEGCMTLCTDPNGVTPADYIIGIGWPSVEAFLAAKGPRGLRDRRSEMAIPRGNPQESFLY